MLFYPLVSPGIMSSFATPTSPVGVCLLYLLTWLAGLTPRG